MVSNPTQTYRTIALSAALIWIFFGSVLAYQASKPFHRITRLIIQTVLFLIAVVESIEFVLNIQGSHFFVETLLVGLGTIIMGPSSTPISPVASGLIVLTAIALIYLIWVSGTQTKSVQVHDIISIIGLVECVVSFTFIQSYIFGNPLLYGTQLIPIAFLSALAAFFTGAALFTAAGPDAAPVKYMIGNTTRARLLRVFVPLVIIIILIENVVLVWLASALNVHDAVLLSISLVVFTLLIAYVVARISERIGWRLDHAEQELVQKNENLNALNEELTATQEELRQTNDELLASERHLMQKNENLNALNEELTATQEELRQTNDVLLASDLHLRQKNENLNALNEELSAAQEELRQNIEELTQAEKILSINEAKLRRFYDSGLIGVIYWNMNGIITDANDKFLDLVGYSREDLVAGRVDWIHMTPPEYQHLDENSMLELKSVGVNKIPFEKEYIRKDGSRVPIIIAGAMLDAARFNGVAFVLDITRRKRSEEALKYSEERFRSVLDSSKDLIYRENLQTGRYEYISPSAETLTGFSADEFLAMDAGIARSIIHPDDISAMQSALDSLESTGEAEVEYRWLMKNGTYRWFSNHMSLNRDVSGRPLYRNGSIRDITQRKNAEEALRENEEKYRTRFNTLIEGFCVIEVVIDSAGKPVDYRFLEINEAFERQTGLHNAQGKLMRSLAPDHEEHWFEIYGKIAVTGEPEHFENEARALNRWYEVRAFKIGGQESRKVGICFNDITERKKSEEELKQKNDDLRVAYEEISSTHEELQQSVEELRLREQELSQKRG